MKSFSFQEGRALAREGLPARALSSLKLDSPRGRVRQVVEKQQPKNGMNSGQGGDFSFAASSVTAGHRRCLAQFVRLCVLQLVSVTWGGTQRVVETIIWEPADR